MLISVDVYIGDGLLDYWQVREHLEYYFARAGRECYIKYHESSNSKVIVKINGKKYDLTKYKLKSAKNILSKELNKLREY